MASTCLLLIVHYSSEEHLDLQKQGFWIAWNWESRDSGVAVGWSACYVFRRCDKWGDLLAVICMYPCTSVEFEELPAFILGLLGDDIAPFKRSEVPIEDF